MWVKQKDLCTTSSTNKRKNIGIPFNQNVLTSSADGTQGLSEGMPCFEVVCGWTGVRNLLCDDLTC